MGTKEEDLESEGDKEEIWLHDVDVPHAVTNDVPLDVR